ETPEDLIISNVTIVDVVDGALRQGQSIVIRDGRIDWVGDSDSTIERSGLVAIDGTGYYAVPGLTDMHVHTHDDSDYLLHLAFGVTTIREMNGWPWRLARRQLVESGGLAAPNMYITSRILNSSDFGGYAIAVNTESAARSAVRAARAAGYDAIKTHNGLAKDVFLAIMDEAHRVGLDVVGHIPVRVSVAEAIDAGMLTAEHFKGYIDDSVLEISSQDWQSPTEGAAIFLTPTFYTYREHLRADDAQSIIDASSNYVLPHRRIDWRRYASMEADELTQLRQTIRPKSEEIFKALSPIFHNWLAGTDSGGYNLMVPGEALIEELEILQQLGLSPLEALRSATTRAADAMNLSDRIGRIAPGFQADLLLLERNPLESVANLRSLRATITRGRLIDNPKSIIENGSAIDLSATHIDLQELESAVAAAEQHAAVGYAQSSISLDLWIELAETLSRPDLAERLRALIM
ncbi:MAG: amidohydrolase family protein, partial [Rhodothermia bacterium]|nr:amidohydrolase family protein [Rhodothermia bacterium]